MCGVAWVLYTFLGAAMDLASALLLAVAGMRIKVAAVRQGPRH